MERHCIFPMIFIILSLSVLSCATANSIQSEPDKVIFDITQTPTLLLEDASTGAKVKWFADANYVAIADVVDEIEYCDASQDILVCIKYPLPLIVQRNTEARASIRVSGEQMEFYTIASNKSSSAVCDSKLYSVVGVSVSESKMYVYEFSQDVGLQRITVQVPDDNGNMLPSDSYTRVSGSLFTNDEICSNAR